MQTAPGQRTAPEQGLTLQLFDELWRQAASEGAIKEVDATRRLHALMMDFVSRHTTAQQ